MDIWGVHFGVKTGVTQKRHLRDVAKDDATGQNTTFSFCLFLLVY
jgi:hypothetical protein